VIRRRGGGTRRPDPPRRDEAARRVAAQRSSNPLAFIKAALERIEDRLGAVAPAAPVVDPPPAPVDAPPAPVDTPSSKLRYDKRLGWHVPCTTLLPRITDEEVRRFHNYLKHRS
jgi:hypothetical protein